MKPTQTKVPECHCCGKPMKQEKSCVGSMEWYCQTDGCPYSPKTRLL